MGSLESKSRSADTAAASKDVAEQQENGHVKTNGDAPAKENGEAAPSNGSAEPAPEDVISAEAVSSANGDPKPEEPPGKAAKKKRFSFKKQFKLPFRNKTKKEETAAAAEAPPADEAAASPKEESSPPVETAEPVTVESAPTEEKPVPDAEVSPSDATDAQPEPAAVCTEEPSKPAESAPTTEPTTELQKE